MAVRETARGLVQEEPPRGRVVQNAVLLYRAQKEPSALSALSAVALQGRQRRQRFTARLLPKPSSTDKLFLPILAGYLGDDERAEQLRLVALI